MDERRKKKIKDILFAVSMLMLAGLFAFIIYMAATKRSTDMLYYGVIVVFLVVFWTLTDILPITLTGGFEGKSDAQKQAYRNYAIIDAVGLAGLGYFAMSLNGNGMMGAIVYAAAIMMKRKFYDEYRDGPQQQEEAAEETAAIEEAPEETEEVSAEARQEEAREDGTVPGKEEE